MKASILMREVEPWIAHLQQLGRSPRTLEAYRVVLGRFVRFLCRSYRVVRMRDVQLRHLEAWSRHLHEKGQLPNTRGFNLRPTLFFFHWLARTGAIFVDPAEHFVLTHAPRRLQPVPSEADLKRLLDALPHTTAVDQRDRALVETAYATGLRLHELTTLTVADVDLEQSTVRVVGKGRKERFVPLTKAANNALRSYLNNGRVVLLRARTTAALWLGKFGVDLSAPSVRAIFIYIGRTHGVALLPHAVRRAFATHLLRNGANPMVIMRLLGHASLRHLWHYLQYTPSDLIAAHRRSALAR